MLEKACFIVVVPLMTPLICDDSELETVSAIDFHALRAVLGGLELALLHLLGVFGFRRRQFGEDLLALGRAQIVERKLLRVDVPLLGDLLIERRLGHARPSGSR